MATAEPLRIVVIGAGIAGLSFLSGIAKFRLPNDAPNFHITVLERGVRSGNRVNDYAHSLSLRRDVGGVGALEELGLANEVRKASTPSIGFGLSWVSKSVLTTEPHLSVALASEWFGTLQEQGIRTTRYQLWKTLLKEGEQCVNEFNWGCTLESVTDRNSHIEVKWNKTDSDTRHTIAADVLVAADGYKSQVREMVAPNEKLNYLGICSVSGKARISNDEMTEIPTIISQHHGLVLGNGSSMFLAREAADEMLVALSFPAPEPFARRIFVSSESVTCASLLRKCQEHISNYPKPCRKLFEKAAEQNSLSAASLFDKLPMRTTEMNGRLVFIGDANHPVSPFAGAGANLAIVDGLLLAKALIQQPKARKNLGLVTNDFMKGVCARALPVVQTQRKTIAIAHASGWGPLTARAGLLRCVSAVSRLVMFFKRNM